MGACTWTGNIGKTQPAATTLTMLDGGGGSVLHVLELDHHPMSILRSA